MKTAYEVLGDLLLIRNDLNDLVGDLRALVSNNQENNADVKIALSVVGVDLVESHNKIQHAIAVLLEIHEGKLNER